MAHGGGGRGECSTPCKKGGGNVLGGNILHSSTDWLYG